MKNEFCNIPIPKLKHCKKKSRERHRLLVEREKEEKRIRRLKKKFKTYDRPVRLIRLSNANSLLPYLYTEFGNETPSENIKFVVPLYSENYEDRGNENIIYF